MKAEEGGITLARQHLVKGGHQRDAGEEGEEGDRDPHGTGSDAEDSAEGGAGTLITKMD